MKSIVSNKRENLTKWEWKGLDSNNNLADGHARQFQNVNQEQIAKSLTDIYLSSATASQLELQNEFCELFFLLSGQSSALKLSPPLFHYSSSVSTEVIANFLRVGNKSVGLIHPTFDNISSILKRQNIHLTLIEEEEIYNLKLLDSKLRKIDAIFLVFPNNPTGVEPSKLEFERIVEICKKQKKILIIDACFRLLSDMVKWDQYEILIQSEVDFIVIEDTGKILPTMDLKVGFLVSSKTIHSRLQIITDDILLNVSPFIFSLLSEYIKLEINNKVFSFQKIVNENRKLIHQNIDQNLFTITNSSTKTSVEWLKLNSNMKSSRLCSWLSEHDVHVLPGRQFFWAKPEIGENFIRIALMRPTHYFSKAIQCLFDLLPSFKSIDK